MTMRNACTDVVALLAMVIALLTVAPVLADGAGGSDEDPTPGQYVPTGPVSAADQKPLARAPHVSVGHGVPTAFVPPVVAPTWQSVILARVSHILL